MISPAAIRLLSDMIEEKEVQLDIIGSEEDANLVGELWELYAYLID